MPRLSIWGSGQKTDNFKFMDRSIAEYFQIGGTAVLLHKYIGVQDPNGVDENGNPTGVAAGGVSTIQDVLFLENRDRAYDPNIYELRGIYTIRDLEFDLSQFGLFLQNDTIFMEVHLNDTIDIIGRKLMAGDVFELPHMRDYSMLSEESDAINKFYVVQEVTRSSDGYSATWFPHILRLKCSPLTDSQEYSQILQSAAQDPFGLDTGETLSDLISTLGTNMSIDEAVVTEAREYVKGRYFETRQYYFVPGSELGKEYPWIFAGDGQPPNGAELIGAGNTFPVDATSGSYYLRTDYEPHVLYKKNDTGNWIRQELDYRKCNWSMATNLLRSFVNNCNKTTLDDGTIVDQRQPLSKVVLPKTDF